MAPFVFVRVLLARREHCVRVCGRAPTPARQDAHRQAPRQGQRARQPGRRQR